MTKVSFYELSDSIYFECKGHAGFAKKGSDIVCAGISALCMAAVHEISNLFSSGEIFILNSHIADGEILLEVKIPCDEYSKIKLFTVFETVMSGFQAIEEIYPDNISVN